MEADCEEIGVVDNKSCNVNFKSHSNSNNRIFSEVTTGELDADLEYDLWEGQFQFLGQDHNCCPSTSDKQVRENML